MNRRDELNEEEAADNEGRFFESEMKWSATILHRGFLVGRWGPAGSSRPSRAVATSSLPVRILWKVRRRTLLSFSPPLSTHFVIHSKRKKNNPSVWMGGVVSIKWTSKSLLNIRYLGICTRRAYDNEPTFFFLLLRENDWLTRLSLYIFGVRALFFEWNFYSTHTAQTDNLKLSNSTILTERLNIISLLSVGAKGIHYFVVVVFSSTHQKEPIRHGLTSNGAVCVCVSPRLFNVPPTPIWDRLHFFFLFYVERLVVAVQVLKAFQSSGFFSSHADRGETGLV